MATYVLLGTLTEEGVEKLQSDPGQFENVKKALEKMDVQILAQYAVLGPYDIVTIIEAPDNRTVVRVSTQLSLQGLLKITTLPALPVEDFLASL